MSEYTDVTEDVTTEPVDAVEDVSEVVVTDDGASKDGASGDGASGDGASENAAEVVEDADADEASGDGEDSLDAEGDIAADYLEELLDIADLDGDIDTYSEGGRAHVSIVTEGDVLVGRNGEVLDALQELARLAVMTETGHRSRLMLDVAGHRERRRKELKVLASEAVSEVKESGEPVRMAPMNPFERKIVHDVVAAAGLVSESEGVEPKRRVVVMPRA